MASFCNFRWHRGLRRRTYAQKFKRLPWGHSRGAAYGSRATPQQRKHALGQHQWGNPAKDAPRMHLRQCGVRGTEANRFKVGLAWKCVRWPAAPLGAGRLADVDPAAAPSPADASAIKSGRGWHAVRGSVANSKPRGPNTAAGASLVQAHESEWLRGYTDVRDGGGPTLSARKLGGV